MTYPSKGPGPRARAAGAFADVAGRHLVDPSGPFAVQPVNDPELEVADAADLHVDVVAVLEGAEALVVGAHEEDVAGADALDAGGPGDRLGDAVGEVAGVVVGPQLAVHREADVQLVGVGDLVPGDDARSEGGKSRVGLRGRDRHSRAARAATACLPGRRHAGGHVDAAGEAENVVHRL